MSSKVNCFNFTQICRSCKNHYGQFKIHLSNFDENGKSKVDLKENYEKFSFICCKCKLLNILNLNELCTPEIVVLMKREMNKR